MLGFLDCFYPGTITGSCALESKSIRITCYGGDSNNFMVWLWKKVVLREAYARQLQSEQLGYPSRFSQTCWALNQTVQHDHPSWKEVRPPLP